MPPKKKELKKPPAPKQAPILPGYAQLCQSCPYKDLYFTAKNQGLLIENLKEQLLAVTGEMERLKSQVEEKNTK